MVRRDAVTRARRGRGVIVAASLVVAMAVLAGACSDDEGSDAADTTESTTTTAVGPDESLAAPDELGPYTVGRATLELDDTERSRPLVADVWYPASADASGDASVYQFIPGIEFASENALADVAVATDGPFPLVVYSHGSGGLRYVASFFTELLASHGFVVASVDHVGNTATELVTGAEIDREQVALNRVQDVEFLIDEMLAASATPDGQFSNTIDPDRVGVTGHSFGGFTALASVGGYSNSLGSVEGDDRVDATVAMAPASGVNSVEELEAVDVPTLLLSGTRDVTTPIDPDTEKAWEHVSGRPLWRVDITDAGHQSFTDVCAYQQLLPTLDAPQLLIDAVDDFATEGCAAELMPIDQAHDLINRNAVAFLLTYVAGEDAYQAFLDEEVPGEVVQVKQ